MARAYEIDSDVESTATFEFESGAVTPSTAATSARGKRSRGTATAPDSEEDEEVAMRPRRNKALRHVIDVDVDEEEDTEEDGQRYQPSVRSPSRLSSKRITTTKRMVVQAVIPTRLSRTLHPTKLTELERADFIHNINEENEYLSSELSEVDDDFLSFAVQEKESSIPPASLQRATALSQSKKKGKEKVTPQSKGKGKARTVISDSEEEEKLDFESNPLNTDDDEEKEESLSVRTVRGLAKALKEQPGGKRGSPHRNTTVIEKRPVQIIDGKTMSQKISNILKGKGKSKTSFELDVEKKIFDSTQGVNGNKHGTKRLNGNGKKSTEDISGTTSLLGSDSDSDGSDFDPSDEEDGSEFEGSTKGWADSDDLEEGDANNSDGDEAQNNSSKKSNKKTKKPSRAPGRKGYHVTWAEKKEMKKMSHYKKTEYVLAANHEELRDCWQHLAETPKTEVKKAIQPVGLTRKLLPFQLEGLHWMMEQEKGMWGGGMLADEMGMGKTIQTIALILSDYSKVGQRKSTLVLAPTVAIMQWRHEFEKFTEGFKVLVFHGSNRIENSKELQKYDVILTSYAVLESGYRREHKGFQRRGKLMKEDSILHKVNWHRVILDEAHNIKDRACNTAKAAFALKAKTRWCLSGTPLQNRVGELYSLVRFIGVDPFSYYFCKRCDCKSLHWLCNKGPCTECGHSGMAHVCYWNMAILRPIQYGGANSGEGEEAFKRLTLLLERLMLRRTKVERADDLGLPPRVVEVRKDIFTEEEEEIYQSLFRDVKRKFNTYADEGTVLNNYSNIFTLITRMRQCADSPDLVLKSRTAQPVQHAPADVPEEILTCRLCLDEAEDAVQTSCRHIFCRECARQYLETAIEQRPECPVCHLHMTIDLEQEALEQDTTGRQGFLSRIDPTKNRTSTKIEALLEELSKLRTEDHTLKSLVFSQFTSMLDLVARRLQLGGFKVVRLQGSMTPVARDNTIKHFMENPEVTVFLISLKAGGVALNLTEASRVFILDPWWNPAVELQAMDRIHRLGQHRPVVVTRLIIENSIESRILELQRKKENLAASALGDDDKAMGRLTPEDLRFLFSL